MKGGVDDGLRYVRAWHYTARRKREECGRFSWWCRRWLGRGRGGVGQPLPTSAARETSSSAPPAVPLVPQAWCPAHKGSLRLACATGVITRWRVLARSSRPRSLCSVSLGEDVGDQVGAERRPASAVLFATRKVAIAQRWPTTFSVKSGHKRRDVAD